MNCSHTTITAEQKTILVVDDDPVVLRSVSALLADDNYNVLTSSSGRDALQQSKGYKREIHVLLSDFQMPGLSGADLVSCNRNSWTNERTSVNLGHEDRETDNTD